MISNVGIKTSYPKADLEKLAKYATGVSITPKDTSLKFSDVANYPLTLMSWETLGWLKNNWGKYGEAFKEVSENAKKANEVFKSGGIKAVLKNADAKNLAAALPAVEGATKASTGIFSKISNVLGITKLTQGVNNLATKSPVFSKGLDAYRNENGTLMLALEGGMETAFNVVPTFKQLGFKKGMKQLAKSAVKTVMSVAGWVAGSAIGSKLGTVASAALGGNNKVCTILGSVLRTVSSYVGGTIAQHFTSKGAQKIVGESELDKNKKEQAQILAEASQEDGEVFNAMLEQVAVRLSSEDETNPEAQEIAQSLSNIIETAQKTSPMMNKYELKAYAQKLTSPNSQTNPTPVDATPAKTYRQPSEKTTQALEKSDFLLNKNYKHIGQIGYTL